MGSPNNTSQPAPSRTSRTPSQKGGSKPLGCLFPLLLLLASAAGLYWFFKNKSGGNPNDFLTSLNLPTFDKASTAPEGSLEQPGFSQSEPINVPPAKSKANNRKAQGRPRKNSAASSHRFGRSQKARVPSGYPLVSAGKGVVKSKALAHSSGNYSADAPAKAGGSNSKRIAPFKLVDYRWFLPSEALIPGSVQSLVSYSSAGPQLAPKPNQIITFKTKIYPRSDAIAFANRRLNAIGFKVLAIPIDDFERGGATVVESQDKNGNQIFFSFKPRVEAKAIDWKIEVYKKP